MNGKGLSRWHLLSIIGGNLDQHNGQINCLIQRFSKEKSEYKWREGGMVTGGKGMNTGLMQWKRSIILVSQNP